MQAGDIIPIFTQLADYDDSQFPLATVKDADGAEISGSPFALTADDDSGSYSNSEGVMPDSPWVHIDIKVYSDSGHTALSDSAGGTDYIVFLGSSGGSDLPPDANIVGIIQGTCNAGPIEDTIVQGCDRTVTVRLLEDRRGNPFDLEGWTELEFRFRNADGTILSVKASDDDTPVRVVNEAGGVLLCILTAAQTADLAVLIPSPFVIKVTKPTGVTIVNLPTQLAVAEQDA